jgi:hypothetical protein
MEENKELDNFIRKSIKEVGLEKPSLDFNDLVLSQLQKSTEKNTIFEHKPLLSKPVWFGIITTVIVIFAYALLGNPEIENIWFSISKLNQLTSFNLSGSVPNVEIPHTFVYGFLIFTFFVVLQVYMVKQRIDKRYDLR